MKGFDEAVLRKDEIAVFKLRSLYEKYGYSHFRMSKFEEYDLYVRNKDFLVSDSIITFTDTNGKLMAMKPDVTLSIIKNSADKNGVIEKLYYNENVYRVSNHSHTFKEIMQAGLECVGDVDTFSLCEVITLAAKSLQLLEEDFILDISHMGIITGLLDEIEMSGEGKAEVIRCIGEKNIHELEKICAEEGVEAEKAEMLKSLITVYGSFGEALRKIEKICINDAMKASYKELCDIYEVTKAGETANRMNLDFSVVNDMKYYNGIVFQGFVSGIAESILSGGQYDKLMRKMGKKQGAIGFAVYLDLLSRLNSSEKKWDADVLLIYDDNSSAADICNAVKSLAKGGKSVLALKSEPSDIKCGEVYRFENGGLIKND